jgi:hypothetical protein
MAFGDNSALFTSGVRIDVENNGTNDTTVLDATRANQLVFTNGSTGDDLFSNFGANDSVVNYQKIFDGNNDGFIQFGGNGILDIDRTGKKAPGADQINLVGLVSQELRYLGSKAGQYVYADSATLRQLHSEFGVSHVSESQVSNDTFNAADGQHVYLYDTALGFNLGSDTISNFGSDDFLVTTSEIYNGGKLGANLGLGHNGVLDLSGEFENTTGDDGVSHGGQIDLQGVSVLHLDHQEVGANGVTYFYYAAGPIPTL